MLIAFPNIFHQKPEKKIKVDVVLGQNLGQIRPSVVKKVKKQLLSTGFFSYFKWGIPFKAKSSACVHTPEWKFKANIATNATFEGSLGLHICPIWVKNGKKLIIFKNFTLVSLKSTKVIII